MVSRTKSIDISFCDAVIKWFNRRARKLPWRVAGRRADERRDPYHALVAESMLQQTQVSRVVEKYSTFIKRFPTVQSLAAAHLDEVLSLWSGLGYYRRARNLHAAARMIVESFGSRVPSAIDDLRTLPGVGRYTAGAIASIAFDDPAPIVDGNVARVLLRIHGKDAASDDKAARGWLWEQAEALVNAAASPAAFNEGLMELGATICLPAPAMPRCEECPVAKRCEAHRAGKELEIPRAKAIAARKSVFCASIVVQRASGAVLLEQRPETGMWAGLWQTPTVERSDRMPTRIEAARAIGLRAAGLRKADRFEFRATHRWMKFVVYRGLAPEDWKPDRGMFRTAAHAAHLAMSSPQKRALGFGPSRA